MFHEQDKSCPLIDQLIQDASSLSDQQNNQKQSIKDRTVIKTENILNNRKRRDIKMEREELANIFCDLVALINSKVSFIENQGQKCQSAAKLALGLKTKKSFKSKKEESEKLAPAPEINDLPVIFRKSSLKEEKIIQERLEKQRKKQLIISNYSQIMKYFIHENCETQSIACQQHSEQRYISSTPLRRAKNFGVYNTVSFTINPLFPNGNL